MWIACETPLLQNVVTGIAPKVQNVCLIDSKLVSLIYTQVVGRLL